MLQRIKRDNSLAAVCPLETRGRLNDKGMPARIKSSEPNGVPKDIDADIKAAACEFARLSGAVI